MITEIPTPEEYEEVGKDCLIQAYDNIFQIDRLQTERTNRTVLWNYHQIVLRTAIILIHQGVESLLKSEIAKISPLLLIDDKRKEWQTLPKNSDKQFSELHTVGGEDLIRTYSACKEGSIDEKLLKHFNQIRIKRNKIIHGLGDGLLDPDEVLEFILWSFTYILGKDSFWDSLLNKLYRHPGFDNGELDYDWQVYSDFDRIEHLNLYLEKRRLKHHFSTDITARPYLCPDCTEKGEMITEKGILKPENKWTFLRPNEPSSTNVSCCVCLNKFEVIREDCILSECKGNVKNLLEEGDEDEPDIWVCLTCWNEEDKNNG
jgi:hypothetical protein